jgi:transcriptional regulator with XRE-family HTH domain
VTLLVSKQIDMMTNEVDVKLRTPMYRPVNIELFRQLMQRTGDGAAVSFRELATDAGVHRNTVNNLLNGDQETIPEASARALAHRLGVDLLVVFEPVCRSTTTVTEYAAYASEVREVPA